MVLMKLDQGYDQCQRSRPSALASVGMALTDIVILLVLF